MSDEQEKTAIVQKITETEAFRMYLELGMERSVQKVMESAGERRVSLTTGYEWSKKNNWVEKAEEFDKAHHDEIMKLALKKAVRSKSEILAICQSVLGQFAKELAGEKIILRKTDKQGNVTEEIKMNKYHPNMADVEKAYKIIKQEIGEGLPEWNEAKTLNLTAIFQQIFKNAKPEQSNDMDTRESH